MDVSELWGLWRIDQSDAESVRVYGDTRMEFQADGTLVYAIRVQPEHKLQIMFLTYHLDGDWLVTNQPSDPREERTKIQSLSEDVLVLSYDGRLSRYCRE